MKIETENYLMRPIELSDVNETYLSWLQDKSTSQYINSAKFTEDLNDLMQTVKNWLSDSNILFLAITDKTSLQHIGNIKFDPVNTDDGYAILGILIGDANYRGKGVAGEVIHACGEWLKENKNISELILGVHENNIAAIRAYEKAGFVAKHVPIYPQSSETVTMTYMT